MTISRQYLPRDGHRVVDEGGNLTAPWREFFMRIASPPQGVKPHTLAASPYVLTAPTDGTVVVTGGTVSGATFTRGRDTVTLPAGSLTHPVRQGDVVSITYSVAPSVTFIPQ